MTVLNQESILGQLVPSVYIQKITLESASQDPPRVVNPHIDDDSETENVTPRPAPSALNVTLQLAIKEALDDDFLGRWFDDEKIRKYIKVWVLESFDPVLSFALSSQTDAIRLSQDNFDWDLQDSAVRILADGWGLSKISELKKLFRLRSNTKKISLEFSTEGDREKLIDKRSEVDDNGNSITDVVYKARFNSKNDNPQHLSYFAVSYLDFETLSEDFNISINEYTENLPIGEIATEVVIDDSQVVGESLLFLTEDGKIWPGAVHRREGGGENGEPQFATYAEESGISQPVIPKRVVNSKLQDFRNVKEIQKLQIDLSTIEKELQPTKQNIFALKRDNLIKEKPNSFFSDICLTRTRSGGAKMLFTMDYFSLLRDNSFLKKIYELGSKREMLQYGRVREMKIVRRRIKKLCTMNSLGSPITGQIVFDKNIPCETIAIFSENERGLPSASNNATGGIAEVQVNTEKDSLGMRTFSAEDRSLIGITDGIYQYGVEIEVEDASVNYLRDLNNKLRNSLKRLEVYLAEGSSLGMTSYVLSVEDPHIDSRWERDSILTSSPGNYEPESNRFTKKFAEEQRRKYRRVRSPWIQAVEDYIDTLSKLTPSQDMIDQNMLSMELIKLIAPESGNPQGVILFIELIEQMIKNLERISGVLEVDSQSNSQPKSKTGTSQKGLMKRVTKLNYWFINDSVDSNTLNNYGYDYLSTKRSGGRIKFLQKVSEDKKVRIPGIRFVTGEEYQERVELETLKYFVGTDVDVDMKIGDRAITSGDQLQNTSFGYLTPAYSYLGDQQKELLYSKSSTAKQKSEDYYSLIEARVALYRATGTPYKIYLDDRNQVFNQSVEEYKTIMVSYFSNLGMRIELPAEQDPIANSDTDRRPERESDLSSAFTLSSPVDNLDSVRPERLTRNVVDNFVNTINPNSLLLGVARPYFNYGFLNNGVFNSEGFFKEKSPIKNEQQAFKTDTINIYDINNPDNLVNFVSETDEAKTSLMDDVGAIEQTPSTPKGFLLTKAEPERERRSLPNPTQLFSQPSNSATEPSEDISPILKALPNQIKSLLIGSINSSVVRKDVFNLKYDFVSDARTSSDFRLNYGMLSKVEYLVGYEETGSIRAKESVWKTLTYDNWSQLTSGNLLCRIVDFNSTILGITTPESLKMEVYDKYFLLGPPGAQEQEDEIIPASPVKPPFKQIDDSIEEVPNPEFVKTNIVGQIPEEVYCPAFRKMRL
jgi:hypothetical protein